MPQRPIKGLDTPPTTVVFSRRIGKELLTCFLS